MMKSFSGPDEIAAKTLLSNHGGIGPIEFRRLLTDADFVGPVNFIDFTKIPPGSTIGAHEHRENEEIYCVSKGMPLIIVGDMPMRLQPGSVAVVHSGQTHSLINDTDEEVHIFVVQVRFVMETHHEA
jgi:mannose-6-phosphate isomerase-like protein (cupin superfamily)